MLKGNQQTVSSHEVDSIIGSDGARQVEAHSWSCRRVVALCCARSEDNPLAVARRQASKPPGRYGCEQGASHITSLTALNATLDLHGRSCKSTSIFVRMDVNIKLDRLMLRPAEAAELIGMSRAKVYELIARGAIPSIRVGGPNGPTRVPVGALKTWIDRELEKTAVGA